MAYTPSALGASIVEAVGYEVSTAVFEGPFEVLLQLVSAQEADIYEISLSQVIDGFLEHVASMESFDLNLASEFVVIAAILLELKSKRLLPGPDAVEADEEICAWEERDLLLSRLLECRTFAIAGGLLASKMAEAARSYPRTAGMEDRFVNLAPDLLAGVTPEMVLKAFTKAIESRPQPHVDTSHVVVERVSVAEAVAGLMDYLPSVRTSTFRKLTEGLEERMEVIVHFLALLELCKQGRVELDQGYQFGDLRVTWLGGSAEEEVLDDQIMRSMQPGQISQGHLPSVPPPPGGQPNGLSARPAVLVTAPAQDLDQQIAGAGAGVDYSGGSGRWDG
ncbi:MAG: segregation/condensation protein A [Actinobacteria bacterium]|nr:segregation/condensation protein A [Actinomycetota bacterium]